MATSGGGTSTGGRSNSGGGGGGGVSRSCTSSMMSVWIGGATVSTTLRARPLAMSQTTKDVEADDDEEDDRRVRVEN